MANSKQQPRRATDERLYERPLPHNLDAERSILGAIILDNSALDVAVSHSLRPEDFFLDQNRRIFDRMIALYQSDRVIDDVTLMDEFQRHGELDAVGGIAYISNLTKGMPRVTNVEHYARIVKEKSLLRSLAHTANAMQHRAIAGEEDPQDLLSQAEHSLAELGEGYQEDTAPQLMAKIVDAHAGQLETMARATDGMMLGIPTGLPILDQTIAGWVGGEFVVVAARPGEGKTALGVNLLANSVKYLRRAGDKSHAAMFSLEQDKLQLLLRLACAEGEIDGQRLRVGSLEDREWQKLVTTIAEIRTWPLMISEPTRLTMQRLRSQVRRVAEKYQTRLVFVDYLQLLSYPGKTNRQEEVAAISRELKGIAKMLGKISGGTLLCAAQLTRTAARNGRPTLEDLRECVTGDTLVVLANGLRVPVKEFVTQQPIILAVNGTKVVRAFSDKVWEVGRRKVFDVVLATGKRIRATATHRLMGFGGWVQVQDIQVGQRIATARRLPEPIARVASMREPELVLLAHMIGDGSYLSGQPLRYATGDEQNSFVVSETAKMLFKCQVNRHKARGGHTLVFSGNGNRWKPRGINLWLRELGIFNQRAHQKHVPSFVFGVPDRQIGTFLRHLWATDGSITVRAGRGRVFYATTSRRLADDIAALLLRLGIVARLKVSKQRKPYRDVYTVDVSGKEYQERFLELVGAFGRREPNADRLERLLEKTKANTNVDTIPKEVFAIVKAEMRAKGVSQRAMAKARGTAYGGTSHFRFAPSRETVADYGRILGSEVLKQIAESDVFWDTVKEVKAAGTEMVYDLTVPTYESWLADGIVSHNSGAIEQDADTVMFIYPFRGKPGKSGAEQQIGQVEPSIKWLEVAKQRNGPTRRFKLAYLPAWLRFEEWTATDPMEDEHTPEEDETPRESARKKRRARREEREN